MRLHGDFLRKVWAARAPLHGLYRLTDGFHKKRTTDPETGKEKPERLSGAQWRRVSRAKSLAEFDSQHGWLQAAALNSPGLQGMLQVVEVLKPETLTQASRLDPNNKAKLCEATDAINLQNWL